VHLSGSPRAVARIVQFLALLIAVHMVAGVLGLLSRWSVAATAVVLAVITAFLIPAKARPERTAERMRFGPLAVVAAAAVAAFGLAAAWRTSAQASTGADTVGFHLPAVARWIQTGSFWHIDQFAPVWAIGNYPQNGDVLTLSAVLPFGRDAFAWLPAVALLPFAGLVAYSLAIELRAPRRAALLCAALFCSIPILTTVVYGGTMPDVFLASTFGAGVLFLLRSFREPARHDLILAGIALGLAFGAKWNGVYVVAIAIAVWGVAWLIARRPPLLLLRRGAVLWGLVGAGGGFWLLRNLLLAGNPVIPVKVQVLGATLFDAPPDEVRACAGFRVADYLGSGHIWSKYLLPAYRDWLGAPAAVLGLGLATAAIFALRGVRRPRELEAAPAVIALCAGAVLIAVAYVLTPFSALGVKDQPLSAGVQSRYLLPVLLLCSPVTAVVLGKVRPRMRIAAELAIAGAAFVGLRRGMQEVPHASLVLGVLGLAAGAALLGIAALARRVAAVRVAAMLLGAMLALGFAYERQRTFVEDRYKGVAPALDWLTTHASPGQRIALAGTPSPAGVLPILPAFGPRFENEVGYPARVVQTVLRPYGNGREWARSVRRGSYNLVLAASGGYNPIRCAPDPPGQTADDWARVAGFVRVAGSPPLTLYSVR
jgi:hypothetical protein